MTNPEKYIKENSPKIEFFGDKKFVLARFLFEHYVVPTKYFGERCMIENKEVVDNGNKQYRFDDIKKLSETEIFIDPKYIICRGKFLDITELCKKNGIFISNDEVMIDTAFNSFEKFDGNLMQSNRIITDPKIYVMPPDYYVPREYISRICKQQTPELIVGVGSGREMCFYKIETILEKLKSDKYIDKRVYVEGDYSIRNDSILLNGKIFSGRFLQKLMVGEGKVSPEISLAKINPEISTPTRTIIASHRDDKKTITIFSDFAIEVTCENSAYTNILMRKNQNSMLVNCAGELREIRDGEILSNIPLNKNTFVLILGFASMTEILVVYKFD